MADTDDLNALQQAVQSVQGMRDALRQGQLTVTDLADRTGATEAREEGFYWVILGQNPPEIAYWERGEWWLAGDPKPWQPEAVTVASDRLVFKPRLAPVA